MANDASDDRGLGVAEQIREALTETDMQWWEHCANLMALRASGPALVARLAPVFDAAKAARLGAGIPLEVVALRSERTLGELGDLEVEGVAVERLSLVRAYLSAVRRALREDALQSAQVMADRRTVRVPPKAGGGGKKGKGVGVRGESAREGTGRGRGN